MSVCLTNAAGETFPAGLGRVLEVMGGWLGHVRLS